MAIGGYARVVRTLPYVSRAILVTAFGLAVTAKLRGLPEFEHSLVSLGVAPGTAPAAAVAVLAAEALAVILLLIPITVRAGAMLGGLLAIAFTGVHATRLALGSPFDCPCFGTFLRLPPVSMLTVDILLAVAARYLVVHPRPSDEVAAPVVDLFTQRVRPVGGLARSAASALLYLLFIAIVLPVGIGRYHRTRMLAEKDNTGVRYGTAMPSFERVTLAGQRISNASLRGRWSLLVFVHPGCTPCNEEATDLASRFEAWRERLNLVMVVAGQPGLGSGSSMARRFAADLGLPMPVVADPDESLTRQLADQPLRSPTSVLFDAEGKVRFVQVGRKPGASSLVSSVDAVLADRPYTQDDAARKLAWYRRPAADGELMIGGHATRLSDLWADRPLLLTFAAPDDAKCKRTLEGVQGWLASAPAVRHVVIYTQRVGAPAPRIWAPAGAVAAVDPGGRLADLYQAHRAPQELLIGAGRLLFVGGPQAGGRELHSVLAVQGTLFTSSRLTAPP